MSFNATACSFDTSPELSVPLPGKAIAGLLLGISDWPFAWCAICFPSKRLTPAALWNVRKASLIWIHYILRLEKITFSHVFKTSLELAFIDGIFLRRCDLQPCGCRNLWSFSLQAIPKSGYSTFFSNYKELSGLVLPPRDAPEEPLQ